MDSGNYKYQFVAGNLALDFVNTVAFRADPGKKKDHLQRTRDVHRWASQAQLPDRAAINSGPLVGTAALCRTARDRRKPVYCLSSRLKMLPFEPPPDRTGLFEPTPIEAFSAIVTEDGVQRAPTAGK